MKTAATGLLMMMLGLGCNSSSPETFSERDRPPPVGSAPAVDREPAATAVHGGPAGHDSAGELRGRVLETMGAAGYTYMRIETGDTSTWVAAVDMQVAVGDVVEVAGGSPMPGFHSRTLDRTFDMIIFAGSARVVNGANAPAAGPLPAGGGHADLPPNHPPIDDMPLPH